jgi:hypothetical protein
MITVEKARELMLSMPEAIELPHFDLASFRINKKIFATLWEKDKKVMVKLSLADQSVFCLLKDKSIYPVPGAWGKQGATFIELANTKQSILKDALQCAWKNVASQTLKKKYAIA